MVGVANRLEKSVERLSSGLRINRAADDAAGLTISEKLRRQVRGLARATLNAQDGISMIQSAEGALNETHSILHRMRELAIQSANDTLTSNDRLEIQKEVIQLKNELNRIAYNTEFNTKKLLDGSQSAIISTDTGYVKGLVTGAAMKGGDYSVSMALLEGGIAQLQRSQIFNVFGNEDKVADGTTMLVSIAQFYDANGVFILDEPQAITLNGNNRSVEVILDSYTTLDNLAASLQNAIVDDEFGLDILNSEVKVINTAQTSMVGDGGYLEVLSGSIGEAGLISFAGNQDVINALGMSDYRSAVDNFIEVSLTDADGKTVTTQTDCDRVSGLLQGIDIQFASQPAQIASQRGLVQGLYFSASDSFTVEAGGQSVGIVIENGYRTLEGVARSMNMQFSNLIGPTSIPGMHASVVDDEIRLSYEPPEGAGVSQSTAIRITNAAVGSVLGFKDGLYSGFVDGQLNRDYLTWGFTKYNPDIASGETTAIEVSDGNAAVVINICTAIGTAVGSATLADMVDFATFQSYVNSELLNASVAIRLDQVGHGMAFTSTRIGKEKVSDYEYHDSIVSIQAITVTGALVTATETLLSYFGLEEGTRNGRGNTNFRVHVKDVDPQYHIGANQWEVMKISMSDMSTDALGVSKLDLTTVEGAERAIGRLDKAIDKVSAERSKLGAFQNRLEYAIANLRNMHGNATASESRIRDADIAQEMIEFTRNQVMNQSGTAMLAQANSIASGILQLLR
jgi:flagellin